MCGYYLGFGTDKTLRGFVKGAWHIGTLVVLDDGTRSVKADLISSPETPMMTIRGRNVCSSTIQESVLREW
ncbi:hypothetical protein Egran_01778 [Elaphomyces granulatus]|uniref:Uncharacterized protein n=1 Tax=Elaphomyces granulatus TaxID=519963 RepID=A0A232M226_9EURO|nr:hypothetical protein Egran_01778 [Elaphomyces granulatus]